MSHSHFTALSLLLTEFCSSFVAWDSNRSSTNYVALVKSKTGRFLVRPVSIFLLLFAQIITQFASYGRMSQTTQGLGLDLSHTFARDAHLAANLFQGIRLSIEQTIAQLQNANFARRKRVQHFTEMF